MPLYSFCGKKRRIKRNICICWEGNSEVQKEEFSEAIRAPEHRQLGVSMYFNRGKYGLS